MKTYKFTWPLLVGWALMVPHDPDRSWGTTPNLDSWGHIQSFDTARECEAARVQNWSAAKTKHNDRSERQWVESVCVPLEIIYKEKK